jgi:hypothetical protein
LIIDPDQMLTGTIAFQPGNWRPAQRPIDALARHVVKSSSD